MHIPDGFLDVRTAAACGALAVGGVALALRVARRQLPEGRVPLVGLTAAFIFVAQMLNFPVAAGTSGHLVGATLAAVLVGPAAAVLVMTAVLTLQCLMLADGGLLALGANLLNMALIAPIVAGGVDALVRRCAGDELRVRLLSAAFAAWCSTVAAALACAFELAVAGVAATALVVPAMTGVHMLIGLVEALITAMVIAAIGRARPELLAPQTPRVEERRFRPSTVVAALAGASSLALVVPWRSSLPDGLEQVASRLAFAGRAETSLAMPWQGHSLGAWPPAAITTVVVALIGTAVAFGFAYLVARALTPTRLAGKSFGDRRGA